MMQPAVKLTIFIGSDERRAHRRLYESVMERLSDAHVAGATVTKGSMGYGYNRRIHSTMNEITMENLPLVIEVVDDEEKLEMVAIKIAEMLGEHGLVQLNRTSMFKGALGEDERSAG